MWDLIGGISSIIGIVVAIPVVWSWIILLGDKRRRDTTIKTMEKNKGKTPFFILVDIGEGEAETQVKKFLHSQGFDTDKLNVLSKPRITKDDVQDVVDELQTIKGKGMMNGADMFHVFYRGPVVLAMIVGEVFSNTLVTVYHHDKTTSDGYESWGPLHRRYL